VEDIMEEPEAYGPVAPGERAPGFALPLVEPEGEVTLASYRGTPFLLGLFRGLSCPFCRRLLATTKRMAASLEEVGVETLAVITTPLQAARLYERFRPAGLRLASDPWFGIHRAYGVPLCEMSEDKPSDWPRRVNMGDVMKVASNPGGELPGPLPLPLAGDALDKIDGFAEIDTGEDRAPRGTLALSGFFLIDRDGIVRWRFIEATENVADYGQHPNPDTVLQEARNLVT
jgi:peroxiredoxin